MLRQAASQGGDREIVRLRRRQRARRLLPLDLGGRRGGGQAGRRGERLVAQLHEALLQRGVAAFAVGLGQEVDRPVPVPRGGQPVGLSQQATGIGGAVRGSIGA